MPPRAGSASLSTAVKKAEDVFRTLIESDDSLTKLQVQEVLGETHEDWYSPVISALARIGKVTKTRGRAGGIQFKAGRARQKQLVKSNLHDLEAYFRKNPLPSLPARTREPRQTTARGQEESRFYKPLERYLQRSGLFDIVELCAHNRSASGKWTNPDLVALAYSAKLQYYVGVFPTLTAVEVKPGEPTIDDIQQTAGYQRFFHSSYLCFHSSSYNGKDFDKLTTQLRDDGTWEASSVYNIGLIVSFFKTKRSKTPDFQLVKEAPDTPLDTQSAESGIDTYFTTDTKQALRKAVAEQVKQILNLAPGGPAG